MSKIEVNAIEPQCGTTLTVGASGDTITFPTGTTIVNNGTQTGFGRTGTVDWDTTPKTTTVTAANGTGYFVNTTAGVITVNLPAGSAGAIVSLADYAATWQTSAVTVTPDGTDKIGSLNENAILNVEGQSVTFVYVDATQGWINTMDSTSNVRGATPFINATVSGACNTLSTAPDCSNYNIATFTGPGTFCVSSIAPGPSGNPNNIDYLVVAGGGGGGTITLPYGQGGSGGGGAGGFRTSFPSPAGTSPVTVQGYSITVGGGGSATPQAPTGAPPSNAGNNSIFSSFTSAGGGGGGAGASGVGNSGGSGAGGGGGPSSGAGGSGNTPPVSPSQGQNGGNGSSGAYGGGSGGGHTGAGNPQPSAPGSQNGGAGTANSINGISTSYSGGGGAGGWEPSTLPQALGGVGGGGNGAYGPGAATTPATPGTINSGGGGGGGTGSPASLGGNGGSGIVIIRYKAR
jgi:hypothetical protein